VPKAAAAGTVALGGGIVIDYGAPAPARDPGPPLAYYAQSESSSGAVLNVPLGMRFAAPRQGGFVLRVDGNEIDTASGRALEINVAGAMHICDNVLTANGWFGSDAMLRWWSGAGAPTSLDALGGAGVAVVDLSIALDVANMAPLLAQHWAYGLGSLDQGAPRAANTAAPFAGGGIIFNDNQTFLNLPAEGTPCPLSAVMLVSGSDVSFEGNQCTIDVGLYGHQHCLYDVLVLAWTVRCTGNRMTEYWSTMISALTIGHLNVTAHNIGSHCIFGLPASVATDPNLVVFDNPGATQCKSFQANLLIGINDIGTYFQYLSGTP
jgi:hypothetical protein